MMLALLLCSMRVISSAIACVARATRELPFYMHTSWSCCKKIRQGSVVPVAMADGQAPSSSCISNTDEMYHVLTQAAAVVREKVGISSGPIASVALVLGSGLGKFSERIESKLSVDYTSIPGMPIPAVSGHAGKLFIGTIGTTRVMCFSGRVHAYEDYRCVQLQFAVRLAALCGVSSVVLTNAAGGCQTGMQHGDVMLITETISLHARSFLAETCGDSRYGSFSGGNICDQGSFRPHAGLMQHMRDTAKAVDMRLPEGVYCISTGPTYETHTEVAAGMQFVSPGVRYIDAFGMSTVPEAMAAIAMGLSFVCLSLISNLAAGIEEGELKHDDVTSVANMSGPKFEAFMHAALVNWPQMPLCRLPSPSASKCLPIAPLPITLDHDLHSRIVDTLRSICDSSSVSNAVFLISQPLIGQHPLPQCFSNAAMMGLSVTVNICGNTLVLCSPLNFAILDEEATFFISALCSVGMRSLLHCVTCSTRCAPSSHTYFIASQSITSGSSISGQSDFVDFAALRQLAALGTCQPSSVFYFSSPGPLSPTDAEVRLMAPASACYGNTSLALAYAAQGAGVAVAVIACDAISAVTESSVEQMCRASSALADSEKVRKPFAFWPEGLSFVAPSIDVPLDIAIKPIEAKHVPKVELDAISAQLKHYPLGDILVLWDQRIPFPAAFVQSQSVEFSSLLHATQHHVLHRTSKLTLQFGTIRGTPVVFSVLPVSVPGCNVRVGKELAAVVRACSLAGCKKVVSFTLGDIMVSNAGYAAVKDHLNLTGSNILYGPNIEEIGPRFPDMTNPYVVPSPASVSGAAPIPVVNVLCGGGVPASPSWKNLGVRFQCQALSDNGANIGIACKHASVPVSWFIVDHNSTESADDALSCAIQNL